MNPRNPKRRQKKERFARLPKPVLSTPAVKTLSHAAFRVLTLLAAEYKGDNNGALGITKSQAAENGIASNNTLYAALKSLEERGLIEETYFASRVPPRPTMYALSWVSIDDTTWSVSRRLPTHEYKNWIPTRKVIRKRVRNAKLKVVKS